MIIKIDENFSVAKNYGGHTMWTLIQKKKTTNPKAKSDFSEKATYYATLLQALLALLNKADYTATTAEELIREQKELTKKIMEAIAKSGLDQ